MINDNIGQAYDIFSGFKIVAGIRYLRNFGTQLQPKHFGHEDEFLLLRNRMNINKKPSKKLQLRILAS
jgi:hypothetical protein